MNWTESCAARLTTDKDLERDLGRPIYLSAFVMIWFLPIFVDVVEIV